MELSVFSVYLHDAGVGAVVGLEVGLGDGFATSHLPPLHCLVTQSVATTHLYVVILREREERTKEKCRNVKWPSFVCISIRLFSCSPVLLFSYSPILATSL